MWRATSLFLAVAFWLALGGSGATVWAVPAQDAAAQRLQLDEDALAQRLAAAVRVRTVSAQERDSSDFAGMVRFRELLEKMFPRLHGDLRREVVADYSLLYTWEGRGAGAPVLLAAHLDTVPAAGASWQRDPFGGSIDGGYVWGRGTLDDKSSLLAILEAVERLVEAGFRPAQRVYLAFGHDEENDGAGAAAMAQLLGERGERLRMVLDEGGLVTEGVIEDFPRPFAMVGIAEKGYLALRLTKKGAAGHSSMPPASTAIGGLARALVALEDNPMPSRLEGPARAMLETLAPELPFGRRVALSNLWLLGSAVESALGASPATAAMIRTTTAVTVVRGGLKANVLPTEASALVNFRILPGDTIAAVQQHVRDVVAEYDVEIETLGTPTEASPVSSFTNPAYVTLRQSIEDVFPQALVGPGLVVGMTDARSYVPIAADVYRFMPMWLQAEDLRRFHGTDERISVAGYADMVRFYHRLLESLSAAP